MARPIQATPDLDGEDAERLIESIESIIPSEEEVKYKIDRARKRIKQMSGPKSFEKIVSPLTVLFFNRIGEKIRAGVYCKIIFKDGNLSISGVEGPKKNGDCYGSCGQIRNSLVNNDQPIFREGWTEEVYNKFIEIWNEWHLNHIRPGCPHQMAEKWNKKLLDDTKPATQDNLACWKYEKEHPKGLLCKPCPVCGYQYGSEWQREEVPEEVIWFLKGLPESPEKLVWV